MYLCQIQSRRGTTMHGMQTIVTQSTAAAAAPFDQKLRCMINNKIGLRKLAARVTLSKGKFNGSKLEPNRNGHTCGPCASFYAVEPRFLWTHQPSRSIVRMRKCTVVKLRFLRRRRSSLHTQRDRPNIPPLAVKLDDWRG